MHRIHLFAATVTVSMLSGLAMAQTTSPDEAAGWTGITEPEEVIEARRVVMLGLERQMGVIDRYSLGEPADPEELRAAAATMEPLLLAFPHLFPPTTNLLDPTQLESPTIALPAIWENFANFQSLNAAAEAAAVTLAETDGAEPLRAASRNLRATCEACHALFTRPYEPPEVTAEDLEFDFDSVFRAE